jgi:hypothetical protein
MTGVDRRCIVSRGEPRALDGRNTRARLDRDGARLGNPAFLTSSNA